MMLSSANSLAKNPLVRQGFEPKNHLRMLCVFPKALEVTRRTIKLPGVMTLTCDAHPHMLGYLLTFEHPYFAVTDSTGAFRIPGVPPGVYRISAWHEGWTVVRRDPDGRVLYEPPHLLSRGVVVPEDREGQLVFELASRL
jgi:hypothetical protein